MKKLLTALASLLPVLGMAQTITKISQFPNTNALGPNQLFVVTAGATNMNVKTSDMPGALGVPTLAQMYGIGLNVTNYVISHTNFDVASFNTAVISNRVQFATAAGYADFAGIKLDYGSDGIRIGDLQGAMGTHNVVIGMSAATNFAAGYIGNTVIGAYSFSQSGAGSTYNTIIGQNAASQSSGSSNIIIGAFAGDQLNGSGHLVFDSTSRSGTHPTTSIIFGQIAATPAEQYIRFNVATNETLGGYIVAANASITNNAVVSGWLSQTGGTNYGDAAKTNWTTASTATGNDLLVTNTAGGSVRVVNGRLIVPANGTAMGGASNLVGGLTLGHTNDQRAYLSIGLTNGSGITNQYVILVTTNGSMSTYPIFGLRTNGNLYIMGSFSAIGAVNSSDNIYHGVSPGIGIGGNTQDANTPALVCGPSAGGLRASYKLVGGAGVGSPSNNLFIAGQCIASNGVVAKIHSTYGPSTNIVPLTVIPNSGSGTNIFEVQDTNGMQCLVVDSNAAVGIGTNAPTAQLSVFGQTNNGAVIFQVGSRNIATASAGGTNLIIARTNGTVGIRTMPANAELDVAGSIYASSSISAGVRIGVGSGYGIYFGALNASHPYLTEGPPDNGGLAGLRIMGYSSTFSPSNNLTVCGQVIASNGMVAKIHSTYGPSTNIVPLTVQPNSGGAQNFVEVYGTNGTTLVQTVNSNGVTHVNPGGGLNPVGCFGALMNNTSNTVVCAGGAGVYTNICGTGFTTITTNGFIGGTQAISAGLTNLNAGYYRVFINASYLGANATTYEFDVVTNGAACTLLEVKNTTDNPARFRTSSGGGIIYLPANCGVQMMVQDGGGGSTINVFRSALTIGTP